MRPISSPISFALLLYAGFANVVFAQAPIDTPAPLTPASPAGMPPTAAPATTTEPVTSPGQPAEPPVTLDYPNNPVGDILTMYEKLTDKVLVRDANLTGPNISIVATQPMTRSAAIRLIEASLLLNGYSLVPDGENRMKIVNSAGGKNPRSEGVPLYANPSTIPAGNQVVSYFMQFRFLGAADAAAIFQQHVLLHTYGSIIQVPNAQALVVTENASLIRQMINLQELIDVPPARVMSEFITLKRADAERVADIITKLIETQNKDKQKGSGGAAAPPPAQGQPNGAAAPASAAGGAGGALFENDLVSGSVQLIPDVRTNRILVITRPVNFPYIKNLIEEFDQVVGLAAPLEYPLKYVSASEVLPVLSDLLTENDKGGTSPNNGQNPQQRDRQQQQQNTTYNTGGSFGGSGSSGSGGISDSHPDLLAEPEGDTGPTSLIVGKTRLIADNKANAIIVIGPPESQEKVRTLLNKIDKRPPQVYLSTVIGQLRLVNGDELGVNYLKLFQSQGSVGNGQTNGIAASAINAASSLIDPTKLTTAAAFPALTGGLALYGTIGKNITVYLRALESTNRFKVLARPVVYTANNKKAVILSGQKVAVPTTTLTNLNNTTDTNAAVASNITYEDVVLKLEVIPLINANNEVNLKIAQVDDSISGSQTISGNTVPTISTQKIVTTVTVPNGGTVALGGLITESTQNDTSGIPVLMHLPWVGPAFRNTKRTKERDELIILIQVNVVQTEEDAIALSREEKNRAETGESAFRFSEPPPPKAQMDSFFNNAGATAPKQPASK